MLMETVNASVRDRPSEKPLALKKIPRHRETAFPRYSNLHQHFIFHLDRETIRT